MNAQPASALLLLVHGSPRLDANEPILHILNDIKARNAYEIVEVGYLDCNEPDIPTALDRCCELGAARIVAVPYFLHTGRHVAIDIPELLHDAQLKHPEIEYLLSDYVGASEQLTDILAERAGI